MTNILRRVLSMADVREPALPTTNEDEDTLIDMEEPEGDEMDSIPNIAETGITNHRDIRKSLILGSEGATFLVGKSATRIAVPKRLATYYSPVLRHQFRKNTRSDSALPLPNIDPTAFYHIALWMMIGGEENKLDVLTDCTRLSNDTATTPTGGIEDACTLLCRMYLAARHLQITAIQPPILEQLETAFTIARAAGRRTPILPSIVMEVWQYESDNDEEEESELWKLLLRELCLAFSSKPLPVFEEYMVCFRTIGPFLEKVGNAMVDRIEAVGGEEGMMMDDGSAVVGEGEDDGVLLSTRRVGADEREM